MGGSIFAFALFVSSVVFTLLWLISSAGVCLVVCIVLWFFKTTPRKVITSDKFLYALIYAAMFFGIFVFVTVFVPYCLVWWLFAIVLWLFLWTSCHLPGLKRILPTTTPPHFWYLVQMPVRGAMRFLNWTLDN